MKEAQADILYEIQHIYFQILEFPLEYPGKVTTFPDFLPLFVSGAINRNKSLHHFITVVVVIKCELQTNTETLGLSG